MLSQVAAKALRAAGQRSQLLGRQPLLAGIAATSIRTYARYKEKTPKYTPPSTSPSPTPTTPTSSSPPKPSVSSSSGAARQTSPGTAFPRDQSWKPKDSIKFGGPAAATGAAASGVSPTSGDKASDTAEFNVEADSSANTEPQGQPGPAEGPIGAQTTSKDQLSADEAFEGPKSSEANTEPSEPSEPLGPLPDLRQGIPSTFAAEYGIGAADKTSQNATPREAQEGLDIAASGELPTSAGGGGRRGPDDYDQRDYETSTDRRRAKFANYMYLSILVFGITGTAYFARPYGDDDEVPSGLSPAELTEWSPGAMYARARSRMSGSMEYYTEPTSRKLLPDVPEAQRAPYTLVLSMEDLMVHSEWTREHGWRTAKRPGIDYFLRYLSQYYELVVFTTVPSMIGDPVLKKLDPFRIVMWPLFREATKYEKGKYIKDLAYLNRPLDKVIMIDTKAEHVTNQPENAIILPKWKGDPKDSKTRDLVALIPFLEYIGTMGIQDVRKVLESFKDTDIPAEFARRESIARQKFQEQLDGEKRPKRSLGGLLQGTLGLKTPPGANGEEGVSEGLAKGKMLSDQIRERGQREYERLEKEIQTNGAKWLKDMEEEEKKFMESSMKDMRRNWFGGFASGPPTKEG